MEEGTEGRQARQAGQPDRLTDAARPVGAWALIAEPIAAAAVALWFARSFWLPGRYVVAFDTVAYSGPNFEVTMDSWRAGRLPLLNEFIFGGVTHLGNPQTGALYPPKVIGLLADANRAMGLLVAAHLVVLAVGIVLLVRRLGCRPPAGLAAALVVCGNGAVLTRSTQFEQILVFAWLPLLLLGITAILRAGARPWPAMAGTAVVTAFVLLAGHPQIVYQLVFVAILWGAALLIVHRTWRRSGDLAIAIGVGTLLAAPQLLAAVAAKRDSSLGFGRTLTELESPALSAQPNRIVQILLGSVRHVDEAAFAGGLESIGHVGVAAAFVAVVGCTVVARDAARRPLAIALGVTALVGVVWALGPRTPVFTFAYDWLPGFDLARASGRWLDVTVFAVAVGAAWGVDALAGAATAHGMWPSIAAGGGLLAVALALGALGAADMPDRWTVVSWLAVAAAVIVAVIAVAGVGPTRPLAIDPLVVAALVVVLIAFEIGALARHSVIDATATSTAFDDRSPGVAGELRDRPGLAVAFTNDDFADIGYLVAGFRPNTNALAEVRSLDGYDGGVQVTDRFVALEASQSPVVDPTLPLRNHLPHSWQPADAAALGVRWVLIDTRRDVATQLPGWRPTELAGATFPGGGRFEVWENPAWVGDAVGRLADGSEVGLGLDRRSATRLVVTVTDPSPMRVIVHHQIAPGWTVRVDGERADIVDADGFFLGVDVPGGTRTVEFSYRPRWLGPSLGLAAAGLVGLVALSALGWWRSPRSPRLKFARYRADGAVE